MSGICRGVSLELCPPCSSRMPGYSSRWTRVGARYPTAGFHATDGFIDAVGSENDLPETADEVVDLTGHLVMPGLVNTHHHFYQTLTRAVPGAQDAGLFDWLTVLYPMWARLTPDDVFVSTQIALAELALSGCTTASDHLYLFPNGSRLDDQVAAAATIGLRVNASRGSMSLGASRGGLPPDSVVEDEDAILADSVRVIDALHDPSRGSMVHIAVSPCSPFSVTEDLMRESAHLARGQGRPATHSPRRNHRRRGVHKRDPRCSTGRVDGGSGVGRPGCVVRTLRAHPWRRNSAPGSRRHGHRSLPDVEHAPCLGGSRRLITASMRVCLLVSVLTDRRPTTGATCSAKRARRCFLPD